MEIQLKVPLVDLYYSKLYKILTWVVIGMVPLFLITMAWCPIISITCLVLILPLRIGFTYFKNYKITGEITLGYHHIIANSETFLLKDMKNIIVYIEREPAFSRMPVILSGTNNIVSFFIAEKKYSFRLLLNNKDIEAVDYLVKIWEETYRLKVGHKV